MVADTDLLVLKADRDPVACAHDELIDAVVDDLLHENIYSIIHMCAVAKPSDVHTWAKPDMLQRGHCLYGAFIINGFLLWHNNNQYNKND